MIRVSLLTISDKASRGEREDESGEVIRQILKKKLNIEIGYYKILPDEKEMIKEELIKVADSGNCDLVITTGGTGLDPRDVTPDATSEIIEKRLYGMELLMLQEGLKHTPLAALSRAVVGSRKKTLIINLPGNKYAVRENLEPLIPVIPHAIEKLKGKSTECAKLRES